MQEQEAEKPLPGLNARSWNQPIRTLRDRKRDVQSKISEKCKICFLRLESLFCRENHPFVESNAGPGALPRGRVIRFFTASHIAGSEGPGTNSTTIKLTSS